MGSFADAHIVSCGAWLQPALCVVAVAALRWWRQAVGAAAFGLAPAALAFSAAALACMALGLVSARKFYDAVDWPVVVLPGALIPVALAFERSGAAVLRANFLLGQAARKHAVAVGASCAFLTPVGHQNNTLILGPGGFRFGDYWRLGLPLEVIVVLVAVPMIFFVWPL